MTSCWDVHAVNPERRLISQAAHQLRQGALLVYPTDTCYALGCAISARLAQERLRRIRQLDVHHDLSLLFADISQLSDYAKVDDRAFAILRRAVPGPFTFILPATHDVPRRLADPRKRTIGVRIPDNAVCQALLAAFGEPLMNSTLQLPGEAGPLTDPDEICERLDGQVDLVLRSGPGGEQCSTVVNLTLWPPKILREGAGDPVVLGLPMA